MVAGINRVFSREEYGIPQDPPGNGNTNDELGERKFAASQASRKCHGHS